MSCNSKRTNGGGGGSSSSSSDSKICSNKQEPADKDITSTEKQQVNQPLATLWEHFVLSKASQHKSRIFGLDLEDERPKPDLASMSAFEIITAGLMGPGTPKLQQKSQSAASLLSSDNTEPPTPTKPEKANAETEAKRKASIPLPKQKCSLPAAFLASLEQVHLLSQTTSNPKATATKEHNNTNKPHSYHHPSNSDNNNNNNNTDEKIFGLAQELALNPEIRRFDSARQEVLVRDSAVLVAAGSGGGGGGGGGGDGGSGIERLTLSKRRLLATTATTARSSGLDSNVRDGVGEGVAAMVMGTMATMMMMSGGLGEGDGRCEVCRCGESGDGAGGAGGIEQETGGWLG